MTSKLTREERVQSLYGLKIGQVLNPSDIESIKMLARMALAAMDSDPAIADCDPEVYEKGVSVCLVAIPKETAEIICQNITAATGCKVDWHYFGGRVHIRALRESSQPAPEYPEVLPCPVLLEPGLRFGKGIKTSTVLAALARRAVYESDMAALTPEERAEFQAGIEDFKALIAQPAPVVPDEMYWQDAPVDGSTRAAAYATGWNACRAAMLQAKSLTTINPAPTLVSLPKNAKSLTGNSPGIPDGYVMVPVEPNGDMLAAAQDAYGETDGDIASTLRAAMLATDPQLPGSDPATVLGKWIPVSERMPVEFEAVIAFDGDQVYGEAMYSSDDGFTIDGYDPCDRVQLQNVTHWMPLPAAPQEVR